MNAGHLRGTSLAKAVWLRSLLGLVLLLTCIAPSAGRRTGPPRQAAAPDSVLARASDALEHGQPWRASLLLAPLLQDSARRTPAAVFLAAAAASEWSGWSEVQALLGREEWLDQRFDGGGRLLLARAALELGQDTVALVQAQAAHAGAHAAANRAVALVLLARALDRLRADSAAADTYLEASRAWPSLADWLRRRAAAATRDSGARDRVYGALTLAAARARIPWSEAAAVERRGDSADAAQRLELLGDEPSALLLRAGSAHDSAAQAAARSAVVDYIAAHPGTAAARQLVDLLDRGGSARVPAEELVVARALAATGPFPRAATAFAQALSAGLGEPKDRLDYGGVLVRLGRYADAAVQLAQVHTPHALAAAAAYQRARALVRDGQTAPGRAALLGVGRRWPGDTAAAASAFYLLADLATDDRHDAEARTRFVELARRYPTSRLAPTARFRAAIIALTAGRAAVAAAELDSLARRYRQSDEALAARYWAGRAWATAGDTSRARDRWRELVAGDPLSYYAGASERRLGLPTWAPAPAPDSFATIPALDSAMARAALLERLGMDVEARWEYDAQLHAADESVERMLATAAALRQRGLAAPSILLAHRAQARGAPRDARLLRLLYPIAHRDALVAEANGQRLDPTFVAALVRQESMFNPRATSLAGARGLMQLMPGVGRAVATALRYPLWDPVLLYQPDVSLQLGAAHLRELAGRYGAPAEILAAYNAGATRVDRWKSKIGGEDPELFVERIPYPETRDYVRIIDRNQALYRVLYDWSVVSPAPDGAPGGR